MLHSGMFPHHSLGGNKFTDNGKRALRAAAQERNSNPDLSNYISLSDDVILLATEVD